MLLRVLTDDAVVHAHATNELLAQKVSDLDQGTGFRDGTIDGEMRIDGTKLVLVAVGDALDHVLDVGADCSHSGQLFLLAEPFLNLETKNIILVKSKKLRGGTLV